jgi:hypothetical protein
MAMRPGNPPMKAIRKSAPTARMKNVTKVK